MSDTGREREYAAAIEAAQQVADGVPAWVVVVAVDAALDERERAA